MLQSPKLEPETTAVSENEPAVNTGHPVNWRWKRESARGIPSNLNGYIRMNTIEIVRAELLLADPQDLEEFRRSCFGHFLRHTWDKSSNCSAAIYSLFCNEVVWDGAGNEEFWYRVGDRFVCFSRREYALVTGLRFGGFNFDIHVDETPPVGSLYERYSTLMHLPLDRIRDAFKAGQFRAVRGDALKVAKVLIACYIVLGFDGQKKYADMWMWSMVENNDSWEIFPWGLYSWQILCHHLRNLPLAAPKLQANGRRRYHFYGNLNAIMVWACEAIPNLMEACIQSRVLDPAMQRPRMTRYLFKKIVRLDFTRFFDQHRVCYERLAPTPEEVGEVYMQNLDDPVTPTVRYYLVMALCKKGRSRTIEEESGATEEGEAEAEQGDADAEVRLTVGRDVRQRVMDEPSVTPRHGLIHGRKTEMGRVHSSPRPTDPSGAGVADAGGSGGVAGTRDQPTIIDLDTLFYRLTEYADRSIEDVRADHERLRADIRTGHERLRADIRADQERLRADIRADHERLRADIRAEHEQLRADIRADIERLRSERCRGRTIGG